MERFSCKHLGNIEEIIKTPSTFGRVPYSLSSVNKNLHYHPSTATSEVPKVPIQTMSSEEGIRYLEGTHPSSTDALATSAFSDTTAQTSPSMRTTSAGPPSVNKLEEPPDLSPSLIHEEQDDNQPTPSSSDNENQTFSSICFARISLAQLRELQTNLHSLRIDRYVSHMLPEGILKSSSLQHLFISDSISLKTFPHSSSLKSLYIRSCKNLEVSKPNQAMNQNTHLEHLSLGSSCESLRIFLLNYFPKLKSLILHDCKNLESLSIEKELQNEHISLEDLEIRNCPNLRFFLQEEVQVPNLTSLTLFNCGRLKSLQGIQNLKSLESLYINKCLALESLHVEGLPSSLIILRISFCEKIIPRKWWKLDDLHSLRHFGIEGGCQELESFPEEGLLPASLLTLRISRFLNLKFLEGEALQKLTSLKTLEIHCCNKLDSLPEHGLPSSLSSLSITDCYMLNPKLQKRKGSEWLKIAHIPSICLNGFSN